jgi:hypothetical protein
MVLHHPRLVHVVAQGIEQLLPLHGVLVNRDPFNCVQFSCIWLIFAQILDATKNHP